MTKVRSERWALQSFATNTVSIIGSEVFVRATNFLVYAWIARRLGLLPFGQLSLALSLFYLFQIISTVGQPNLITRDIAIDPGSVRARTRSARSVVMAGTALSMIPLAVLIALFGWETKTIVTILIVFTGLLPNALSQVLEGVLRGLEKMQYIALANVPIHLLKAVVAYVVLVVTDDIRVLGVVFAATYWLVYGVELLIVRRLTADTANPLRDSENSQPQDSQPQDSQPQAESLGVGSLETGAGLKAEMTRGASFFGVDVVYAMNSTAPVLVVSALLGEESVGVLGAAMQAVVPLSLVINSVVRVAFPAMCRKFESPDNNAKQILVNLMDAILSMIVPLTISIGVFAGFVAEVLYDNGEFEPAAVLLRFIIWWSIVDVLATVMGQSLWASAREGTSMRIGLVSVSIGLIGNLLFVSLFGLNGVAVTMLFSGAALLGLHYRQLTSVVSLTDIFGAIWRPAAAGLVQVGFLLLFGDVAVIPLAAAGIVVYLLVLLLLDRLHRGNDDDGRSGSRLLSNLASSLGN
ncbi:MAG: oligosaccharide flippase family protein [Acidimicrobiales bacterium]